MSNLTLPKFGNSPETLTPRVRHVLPVIRREVLPITLQISTASKKENLLATVIGALLGAIVPVMVFAVSHKLPALYSSAEQLKFYFLLGICLGGCAFSFKSVYQWGHLAFQQDNLKAIGFSLLLEGCLIMSGLEASLAWLGWVALAYLMAINAISAGCAIACEGKSRRQAQRDLEPIVKKVRKPAK